MLYTVRTQTEAAAIKIAGDAKALLTVHLPSLTVDGLRSTKLLRGVQCVHYVDSLCNRR
jgi:hypothetical protein